GADWLISCFSMKSPRSAVLMLRPVVIILALAGVLYALRADLHPGPSGERLAAVYGARSPDSTYAPDPSPSSREPRVKLPSNDELQLEFFAVPAPLHPHDLEALVFTRHDGRMASADAALNPARDAKGWFRIKAPADRLLASGVLVPGDN